MGFQKKNMVKVRENLMKKKFSTNGNLLKNLEEKMLSNFQFCVSLPKKINRKSKNGKCSRNDFKFDHCMQKMNERLTDLDCDIG